MAERCLTVQTAGLCKAKAEKREKPWNLRVDSKDVANEMLLLFHDEAKNSLLEDCTA